MTGGQAVVAALKAHDVEVVFGMPGVHNLSLYDALYDAAPEIQHVVVRHEQAAGFAADGYARATGISPWRSMMVRIFVGSGGVLAASAALISRKYSGPSTPGVRTHRHLAKTAPRLSNP